VEHQIWLLRNVLWWYLLPLMVPVFVFIGHVAWLERDDGWESVFEAVPAVAVVVLVTVVIYWVNQLAVRKVLAPRRDELRNLLASLKDESGSETATSD
jgi:hypothetical protein